MTYEEFINNEVLQVEKEKPLPKYPIIIEAMKVFLLFAGAVSIVSYAAYYSGGFDAVLYTLPLYVQPWITTFVRRRFSKVVLDEALFVIFAAWLLLSPALVVTLLAGAYMLAVTAYQIVREFSESEEREAGIVIVCFNAVLMLAVGIFAIIQGLRSFEWWLGGLALMYAVLFARYLHYIAIEGAIKHLEGAVQHSNFSVRRVRRINNRIVWSFVIFMLTAVGTVYLVGLNKVVEQAAVEVMEYIEPDIGKGYAAGAPGTGGQMSDRIKHDFAKWDGSTQEENGLTVLMGDIIQGIILGWCVIAVVALIIYLIHEERMRRREERDFEGLDYEETHEFYRGTAPKGLRKRFASILDRSPENLVRRTYYKRVKGEMGKKVKRSDTPMQVGIKLSDLEPLVQQYNEVRYREK